MLPKAASERTSAPNWLQNAVYKTAKCDRMFRRMQPERKQREIFALKSVNTVTCYSPRYIGAITHRDI
ncbi:hypothetical protein GCM10007359_00390 [Rothia aerolata]|uniref:Uncharacterized protein n=1 Tax=Rothia aerolata TaxID=1812262 RepID=A0A917MRL3_9MICC|nr:hypothetical protein GCM10007359_00390 [Rothia aerolata]